MSNWTYIQNFLSITEAELSFERLQHEIEWEQGSIVLFGKKRPEPRLKSWHSQSDFQYAYSGVIQNRRPYTQTLVSLQEKLREALPNESFNSVLLNFYRNEADSMGWHSDDEPTLGPSPVIASVSLGSHRPMLFRRRSRSKGERSQKILLESGSLLIMDSDCQKTWQHALPKLQSHSAARINLTFRKLLGP